MYVGLAGCATAAIEYSNSSESVERNSGDAGG